MHDDDELLDVVDANDKVVGTTYRNSINYSEFKGNLRAAELLIINDKGEIWIPRRVMTKRIAPGGLDFSAAGHVSSGDDYEDTLHKEVEEELNLKLDSAKLEFLNKFSPSPSLPPYFRAVYLYHSNDEPNFNKDDFSGAEWIEPKELIKRLKAGDPAKESLLETIEYIAAQKPFASP